MELKYSLYNFVSKGRNGLKIRSMISLRIWFNCSNVEEWFCSFTVLLQD